MQRIYDEVRTVLLRQALELCTLCDLIDLDEITVGELIDRLRLVSRSLSELRIALITAPIDRSIGAGDRNGAGLEGWPATGSNN